MKIKTRFNNIVFAFISVFVIALMTVFMWNARNKPEYLNDEELAG